MIKIFYNMLCAVRYMHSTGLIHRNLDPNHFLVRKDCNVLLCGFSAARPNAEDMLTNNDYFGRYLTAKSPKADDLTPNNKLENSPEMRKKKRALSPKEKIFSAKKRK